VELLGQNLHEKTISSDAWGGGGGGDLPPL
jgi:hypothetical protein